MKRILKVSLEIGDKNANGRVDVSGEIEVLGKRATLPPRDLPRQPILAVVAGALEALKIPADTLRSLGLPAISVRAINTMINQRPEEPAKKPAKEPAKA